ncbi:MAG: ATP synthase F0, C subunit [candidate division TM6 bacterium GW2011_GWF2_43_17]|nr:MAG: ATP synthase F0, C subunit [candidate division TM6 bacterium GW2011_GWF2_43_17]HAU30178.1 F0F1 ATP synthase subunit C [Candidatus Dependentiae bacterium]
MEEYVYIVKSAAYLGAAIAMAIGAFGPAIGQALVASRACENIGKYPEKAGDVRAAMIISLGFIEASAIYVLLVAGALLYLGYSI